MGHGRPSWRADGGTLDAMSRLRSSVVRSSTGSAMNKDQGGAMFGHMRTAMKFFTYGLAIGVLFAPRSGKETRAALFDWVNRTAKETFGL
jgi:hypothetical protein